MNKGIAVNTILLIVIGILVVGVLVYLVYLYTKTPIITESECRNRATTLCTHCQTSGWGPWPDSSTAGDEKFYEPIWECAVKYPDKFGGFAQGGVWTCTRMKTPCKMFGIE